MRSQLRSRWDREITRLAVPALGALLAEPAYVLADTAVVGHLGTAQLAGLAVAATILVTGYSAFIFLAYGTTAAVARLIGAGNEREAAEQGVQGLWLSAVISAGLLAATLPNAGRLVRAFGATGDAAHYAERYLWISLLGLPAVLAVYAGTGYLRGRQDTRTPLLVAVGSAGLNLVAEVICIYGLGFGIGASAATTVAVQYGAAAIYVLGIGRQATAFAVRLRPDPRELGRLARVSVALLVRTIALRFSLTAGTVVAAQLGAVEVGAHQVAFELWNGLALALDALAIAGQAMVGRLLGSGDATGARAASVRLMQLGVGFGVLAGLAVLALRGVLPALFTGDPEVRALVTLLLLYVAIGQPVNAVVFILDGVLMGAGDMRYLAFSMVVSILPFAAAVPVLIGTGAGLGWLWTALLGLMLLRLVTLFGRFRGNRWAVTGAIRS